MEKLEAIILIVVVLAGAIGLYYFFSAGAGEATRMLATCTGDMTGNLYIGRVPGTGKTTLTCRTRGDVMHTVDVALLSVEGDTGYLQVGTEPTGPLKEGDVFLPMQSFCGIKIDEIRPSNKYVQFCMADTEKVCVAYEWKTEEIGEKITGSRVCVQELSSSDTKFGLAGQGRFETPE